MCAEMSDDSIHRPLLVLRPLRLNITPASSTENCPMASTVFESPGEERDHGISDCTDDAF